MDTKGVDIKTSITTQLDAIVRKTIVLIETCDWDEKYESIGIELAQYVIRLLKLKNQV